VDNFPYFKSLNVSFVILGKHINNISGLQFYNLLRYGTIFLIGVVFAKTGLTNKEIGDYEALLLIAGAVSFFWLSGIIQSFIPLYKSNEIFSAKKKGNSKSPELFNAFILICIFSLAAGFLILICKNFFSEKLNDSHEIPYINILFLYVILIGPASLVEYVYLLKSKSEKIVIYGLISFFLHFILVAGPVIIGYPLEYSLWGLVIINVIRIIWLLHLMSIYAEPRFSLAFMKKHIAVGIPLIISILLSGSATYIDGIIIMKFDKTNLAVFRYGARELPLVMLLANAFSISMLPAFRENIKIDESLKKIRKESARMIRYLFPLSIIMLLTSRLIYPIIFDQEFLESSVIFNIYLLIIVSRLVFPQTILIGLRKTKVILLGSAMEIILNVSLSFLFINILGIAGVALATIIAFYFEKLFLIIYNYYKLKISPATYIPWKLHLVYSLLILIIFFFVEKQVFI